MAQLDSTIPVKWAGSGTLVLTEGGATSVTVTFEQGTFTWTESGRAYTEAMSRGRHYGGGPRLIETTDANVTGQFTFIPTSFYGSTAATPYEMMLFKGVAASYTTVASGSKKALKVVLTINKTEESESNQTATFNYCVFTEVGVDMAAADGLGQITASFADHENTPTIA